MRRKMVAKSLIAALAVVLVVAICLLLCMVPRNTPPHSDHFYSKAAVAADAGRCSEVGR